MIINVYWFSSKVPFIFYQILIDLEFLDGFSKNINQIS